MIIGIPGDEQWIGLGEMRERVELYGITRPLATQADIDAEFVEVHENMRQRGHQHSLARYTGPHETYGVLAEEVQEYLDAMTANDLDECIAELRDIAVTAIFGAVSLTMRKRGE